MNPELPAPPSEGEPPTQPLPPPEDPLVQRIRELETQLLDAARLATLGEVAAGVVHDLAQPLLVLSSYLELMRRSTRPEEELRLAMPAMENSVNRMNALLRQFREYARGDLPMYEAVHLRDVIESAAAITGAARRDRVRILGDAPVVRGDANRLEQVFVNLLTNALKVSASPVEIELRGLVGAAAVVEVRDRGPGVPEALRARIFEPFFTTSPHGGGTGIGLAVVARVVQEHRGTVTVEDNPGGGAVFRVVLPPLHMVD